MCLTAFTRRFSTIRSTFGGSIGDDDGLGRDRRPVRAPTDRVPSPSAAPGRRRRSARRSGVSTPRASRSRSRRFVTNRSSRRALCSMRPASSRVSSGSSPTSPRSSVIAIPRIAASGVRRSWETAWRNVSFISSSARSRAAASRSTSRARSRSSWARLRSLMSRMNPENTVSSPTATGTIASSTGIMRPSRRSAWISIREFRTAPSPVSCQRRSPSLWAARCAWGTIVSTSERPSTSSALHPKVVSA